jgi:PAS domain S-box-containing protein
VKVGHSWAALYQVALRDYLSGAGESGLHRAYELGRQAIEEHLSLLDVAQVQHELLADLLGDAAEAKWQLDRTTEFFVESLSPFEMTQRGFQEANEKLLRWKHVFEHAGWGIVISSRDGHRLEAMNPAFAAMHGYPLEELAGRSLEDILVPELRPGLSEELRRVQESGHRSFESSHVRKDGTTFQASVDATAVRNERGETLYLAINVQDITDRKRYEEALKRAKAATEEANRELEAFSYSVAHDLRAPLRSIDGFSRMLLEDNAEQLNAEGKRKLDLISAGARNMGRLIDDLLSFSRLGRAALRPAAFDMTALARDVLGEILPMAPGRKIEANVGLLGDAWGDRSLFRQVWVNLIGNAIKYTGKKDVARIDIGASFGERENTYWIKDNGAGFKMEYAKKLFGVFQRLHSTQEFEGTGVGLALVQRLVHRHGGRVWAEGRVDEGATFSFTLPRKGDSNGATG